VIDVINKTIVTSDSCEHFKSNLDELLKFLGEEILKGGYSFTSGSNINCDNWDYTSPNPGPLNISLHIRGEKTDTSGNFYFYHNVGGVCVPDGDNGICPLGCLEDDDPDCCQDGGYTWDSLTNECCGDDGVNDNWCNSGDGSCVSGNWYDDHCTDNTQNCDEDAEDCGGNDCDPCVVVVSMPDVSDYHGQEVLIPVNMDNSVDVGALMFDLLYDSDILNFNNDIDKTTRSENMDDPAFNSYNGKITIILYSGSGKNITSGSGPILNINFTVSGLPGQTSDLNITELSVSDPNANEIPSTSENGTFTVTPL
jgi:hypothetical protein